MPAQSIVAHVLSNRFITPTVYEIRFRSDIDFAFEAGQFVSIIIPGAGPNGRDLRRAYSIASEPKVRPIELCVKLVPGGPGSNYLAELKVGDTFKAMAPYGDFVYQTNSDRHVVFLSTGTGIAPFRSMIFSERFRENMPVSTRCIFGARGDSEILYQPEMKHRAQSIPRFFWTEAITGSASDEKIPHRFYGRVTDYLRSIREEIVWDQTDFYLCGGGAMITEVKNILTDHGVVKANIHQEVYYKEPKST